MTTLENLPIHKGQVLLSCSGHSSRITLCRTMSGRSRPGCSHVTRKSILCLNSEILRLPKRMPVPEVATYKPMCARPYARVGRLGHYHDILASVEWLREQKWSLSCRFRQSSEKTNHVS